MTPASELSFEALREAFVNIFSQNRDDWSKVTVGQLKQLRKEDSISEARYQLILDHLIMKAAE